MSSRLRRWTQGIGGWLLAQAGPDGAYGAGLRYLSRGDVVAAAEAFEDAQRLWARELGAAHRFVAMAMARRAFCYVSLGRVPEGVRLYERALALERGLRGDSDRARTLSSELARARARLSG